ncbi:MFS transporter [Sphingobacterium sp. JUb56]|uniref:MFS transporter n=1 Tax=Sphingobacterium sp. JUb56 TaxID=2587145 RepID=UPI00161332FA|nr:MFS transporter [Sphingobacterium sp. JUb56]MBB2950809.1 putative MFS family arabinose efflux permease [Sphingobacterium sp. JUb56]
MKSASQSIESEKLDFFKVLNLGIAQIVLWGGSYFLLSVLAKDIMAEMNWSYQQVYGCLSLALLVSGLLLPTVGRTIQHTDRHAVLLFSGLVMAIGLIVIGSSSNFLIFASGWVIIGIAMAMGLYDALFAAIGKKYSFNVAKSLVWITLVSSLAPSVSWIFTSYILDSFGWRNTCYTYAILLIISIFPIHLYVFKNKEGNKSTLKNETFRSSVELFRSKLYYLLSANFTLGSVISSTVIIYLIEILLHGRIEMSMVLVIIAFLGPSQAMARVIELIIGKRTAIEMSFISTIIIFLGMVLIFISPILAIPGVIVFGIGNGMRSVLRGTLPLSVYGRDNYALIIGRLARMPLLAQATAPFLGGYLIQQFGMVFFLCVISFMAIINIFLIALIKQAIEQYKLISIHE